MGGMSEEGTGEGLPKGMKEGILSPKQREELSEEIASDTFRARMSLRTKQRKLGKIPDIRPTKPSSAWPEIVQRVFGKSESE